MIQVFIDETQTNYLDADGLPIALSFQIDDPDNPGAISGAYSKRNLTLPADKKTVGIFGAWEDGSDNKAGAANRKAARIDADGVSVFRGFAQLEEVPAVGDTYRRKAESYKVALIGNNAGWFAKLQSILIRDVVRGYVTGQDFTEAWAATKTNATPGTDKYGLFLARVKDWSSTSGVKYTDHSFFAFVVPMITEAFRLAGYKVASEFFATAEAKRYIHILSARPFPEDYGRKFEAYVEDANNPQALPNVIGGGSPALIKITGTAVEDDMFGRYDPATGFYTVAFSGHYTLTWGGKAENFYIVLDNALGLVVGSTLTPGSPLATQSVFLTAGQQIGLFGAGGAGATAGRSIFGIKPAFEFGENYTIDLGIFTDGSWTAADMLLGFGAAFNLQFDTNVDAYTVRIEPADSYITGGAITQGYYTSTREDFTRKIDLKKTASYKAINSVREKYRLQWLTDSADTNADDLERQSDMKLYDARYPFPDGRFAEGETVQEVKYWAKTVMYRANEIRHSTSVVVPILPLLQTAKLNERDSNDDLILITKAEVTEPRILYFAGRRAGLDGYVKLSGAGAAYDFPAAWFVNYSDQTGASPSLSFATEPTDIGEPVPGLMSRFHLQSIARKQVGRMAEEWVMWKALDIVNLNFRTKILINGATYILKRVDGYRPGNNGSVKTLLEFDTAPETARVSTIENPDIRGIIQ